MSKIKLAIVDDNTFLARAIKEKLEDFFNRPVDLVIDKKFKNPYFDKSVNNNRETIYER